MILEHCDHKLITLGRLGDNPDDRVIAGDESTWGEGGERLGELNVFAPTLGALDDSTRLIIGNKELDLKVWEIEEQPLKRFITDNLEKPISEDEMQLLLWWLSDSIYGSRNDEFSCGSAGEIALDEVPKPTKGRFFLYSCVRYDSKSEWKDDEISWLDDVLPDDDSETISILAT